MVKRYKWLVRDETLLTFDREGTINFSGAIQVQRVGDHCQIHSLLGESFYKMIMDIGVKPFRERQIKYVQAAVSESHLRHLKRQLKRGGDTTVEDVRPCTMPDGTVLRWILITVLPERENEPEFPS